MSSSSDSVGEGLSVRRRRVATCSVFSEGISDGDRRSSAWISWMSGLGPSQRKHRALLQGNSATAIDSHRHKTGHFIDVLPSQSLGLVLTN